MRYREAKKIKVGDLVSVKYPSGYTRIRVTEILNTGTFILFVGVQEYEGKGICTLFPNHRRLISKIQEGGN